MNTKPSKWYNEQTINDFRDFFTWAASVNWVSPKLADSTLKALDSIPPAKFTKTLMESMTATLANKRFESVHAMTYQIRQRAEQLTPTA